MNVAEEREGFSIDSPAVTLRDDLPAVDEILELHRSEIGGDFTAYRNHTYRVVNLCLALSPDCADRLHKVCIAAAFHDLGIWTAGTFDYLSPSVTLAQAHLERIRQPDWAEEITAMVLEQCAARGRECRTAHAADGNLRIDRVQLAHERAGVQIAGRLATRDHHANGWHE